MGVPGAEPFVALGGATSGAGFVGPPPMPATGVTVGEVQAESKNETVRQSLRMVRVVSRKRTSRSFDHRAGATRTLGVCGRVCLQPIDYNARLFCGARATT
jgi:hypothetical protein